MSGKGETWAIVLAGGEGSRLHCLTTTTLGVAIPKQFCSLQGGRSLLHDALKRAEPVASPERICAAVSQRHRQWWGPGLSALPNANIIVQPRNCGTANGILLPLLYSPPWDPSRGGRPRTRLHCARTSRRRCIDSPSIRGEAGPRAGARFGQRWRAVERLHCGRPRSSVTAIVCSEVSSGCHRHAAGRGSESIHSRPLGCSAGSLSRFARHRFLSSNPARRRTDVTRVTRSALRMERSGDP